MFWGWDARRDRNGRAITVLDLSNNTRRTIHTDAQIREIKIVDNTIFALHRRGLVSWHLVDGAEMETVTLPAKEDKSLALSHNCSQVAYTSRGKVSVYDVKAGRVLSKVKIGGHIFAIQFSPNDDWLWLVTMNTGLRYGRVDFYHVRLGEAGNPRGKRLEGGQSWDSAFRSPHEYRIIETWSEWVSGPEGKVLWLPPNWRSKRGLEAKWNGNFLAFVHDHHPEPIIIEFKS